MFYNWHPISSWVTPSKLKNKIKKKSEKFQYNFLNCWIKLKKDLKTQNYFTLFLIEIIILTVHYLNGRCGFMTQQSGEVWPENTPNLNCNSLHNTNLKFNNYATWNYSNLSFLCTSAERPVSCRNNEIKTDQVWFEWQHCW